ncbi:hypothetical protein NG895_12050 [Aeoliella sp. ICT_H6.2]|uniref:Uncharacterized protein n=1 Tax=Aeoliella straminimaris TaxID=2954799 RepID=A0A9X2F972_9BACT|nr:hypothetical protein [Aeoliella straminimaris]MCO6044640.1 hypothetical protein [Aeoliella straminimaris]
MQAKNRRLWTKKQLAAEIQITERAIELMVKRGELPEPDCRIGRRLVRWTDKAVQDFINAGGTRIEQ